VTAYHDLDSPQTMQDDAAAAALLVGRSLAGSLPREGRADLYSAYAQDLPKRGIEVSEAAQRLASALGLSLD